MKYVYNTLKQQGCDDSDPFLTQIKSEYDALAAEHNEQQEAEREARNPAYAARKRYDEGNFEEAVEKYQEAIEKEEDSEKKAQYYFAMASIQFRQLNDLNNARNNAMEATKLRDDWGRPYMLVGRSEEHTSELQSRGHLVCRLLLEKKKKHKESQKSR